MLEPATWVVESLCHCQVRILLDQSKSQLMKLLLIQREGQESQSYILAQPTEPNKELDVNMARACLNNVFPEITLNYDNNPTQETQHPDPESALGQEDVDYARVICKAVWIFWAGLVDCEALFVDWGRWHLQ